MKHAFIIIDLLIQLGFLALFTGIATFILLHFPSGNLGIMSMLLILVLGITKMIIDDLANKQEDL